MYKYIFKLHKCFHKNKKTKELIYIQTVQVCYTIYQYCNIVYTLTIVIHTFIRTDRFRYLTRHVWVVCIIY